MFRFRGLSLVLLFGVAGTALAGPLVPGQTGNTREEDGIYPMPSPLEYQGALLAERSEPFRFETVDQGLPRFVEGTFTSRVYRDAQTGGLAFLYQLGTTRQEGVVDLERVNISGMGTGPTDVYTGAERFGVTRTPDGDRLEWVFDAEGLNEQFLVRTPDAGYTLRPGGFQFVMDFEPSGDLRTGTFAAYAPVPEPSAAAGLLMLGGATLLRRSRRCV